MAPCFVAGPVPTYDEVNETLFQFWDNGIYSIAGPNWDDNKDTICDTSIFPDWLCDYMSWYDDVQPASVKSETYWYMNALADRFQEYDDDFTESDMEASLIDLSQIDRVPVDVFIGTDDDTCSEDQAEKYLPELGVTVDKTTISGATHEYFSVDTPSDFVTKLAAKLVVPDDDDSVIFLQ